MFIRFVVGQDSEDHRQLVGIITEARVLRDEGLLHSYEEELLEDTYAWLNAHLPVPPFEDGHWPQDAVSWFRDDAIESIEQMRVLSMLLQEHGRTVRVLRSENPGKIYYEDPFQVVVQQWNSLKPSRRRCDGWFDFS